MSASSFQARYETVKKLYVDAKQEHVFTFWDGLSDTQRTTLLQQLEGIQINRVNEIYYYAGNSTLNVLNYGTNKVTTLSTAATLLTLEVPYTLSSIKKL